MHFLRFGFVYKKQINDLDLKQRLVEREASYFKKVYYFTTTPFIKFIYFQVMLLKFFILYLTFIIICIRSTICCF